MIRRRFRSENKALFDILLWNLMNQIMAFILALLRSLDWPERLLYLFVFVVLLAHLAFLKYSLPNGFDFFEKSPLNFI